MTHKSRISIFLLVILVLVLAVLGYSLTKSFSNGYNALPKTEELQLEKENSEVEVVIDFGNNNKLEKKLNFEQGQTAFSVLEKTAQTESLELETQQYDFGILVKSIKGYENSTDLAWIYFINGESGSLASNKYQLKEGDAVEWKYLKPNY